MSEQSPETPQSDEREVEGHKAGLRPEEVDEQEGPEVEGHMKTRNPEEPLKQG